MYTPSVKARTWKALALASLLAGAACSDHTDDDIRAHVTVAVTSEGPQATAAAEYLARFGRRAIPTVEAAMHTASVPGRKNLILALRKIGDAEAVPLLRHLAIYEPSPDVRREAEWTLKQWAAGTDARAERAKAAVRAIDEQKGTEEAG
jgi:hypothetical protein